MHWQVVRDFLGPGHWSLKIDGQSGVQGADPGGGGGSSWVRTQAAQGRAREEFDIFIYRNSILRNSAKVQYLSKDT